MIRPLIFGLVGLSLVVAVGSVWSGIRQHQITVLTLATGSKTGAYYPFGRAIQEVVAQHAPTIRIEVIPTNGSQENMNLLAEGKVDLALAQSDTPGDPEARVICLLYPELFHLLARADSKIKSVIDLKGHRIALMPQGSGSNDAFWILAKHYNLSPEALTVLNLTPEAAQAAFQKGEVSATFRVLPVGNSWAKEVLAQTPGQLIGIDQAAAMRVFVPYLEAGLLPKGVYQADPPIPAQDLQTVGVQALLLSQAKTDPEVIKTITSILFEYRYDLVKLDPKAASISSPSSGGSVGLPLHPGARSYYDREKPDFLSQHSDFLGLLLSLLTLGASGFWSLRSNFVEKQKNRADQYNLKILNLSQAVTGLDRLDELERIRLQLFEIFRTVVEDLDHDQISPESFQSFSFTWEAAISIIHHRELVLLNRPEGHSSPPDASAASSD